MHFFSLTHDWIHDATLLITWPLKLEVISLIWTLLLLSSLFGILHQHNYCKKLVKCEKIFFTRFGLDFAENITNPAQNLKLRKLSEPFWNLPIIYLLLEDVLQMVNLVNLDWSSGVCVRCSSPVFSLHSERRLTHRAGYFPPHSLDPLTVVSRTLKKTQRMQSIMSIF